MKHDQSTPSPGRPWWHYVLAAVVCVLVIYVIAMLAGVDVERYDSTVTRTS